MYKNRIKAWGLSKYLTQSQAESIVQGDGPAEKKQQAERSMVRRRTRQQTGRPRSQTIERPSSNNSDGTPPPPVQQQPLPPRPIVLDVTPPTPQPPPPQPPATQQIPSITTHNPSFTSTAFVTEPSPISTEPPTTYPQNQGYRTGSLSSVLDLFLLNLRAWTHEAYMSGHWEGNAGKHSKGRHASRRLASDLQAGIKLLEQNNTDSAWRHWRQAVAHFQDGELFKTWYHETPVRLLFEVSRIHHGGHPEFAKSILNMISSWAERFLEKPDPRYHLYKLYGEIPVDQLRSLHVRAAHCMLDGLSSRLDKDHRLLFEVRLNRALDMTWFDPTADLTQWLPSLKEIDHVRGPNSVFSVYYLLLQAYQLVARGQFDEADSVVVHAKERIDAIAPGDIDGYRLAMAYRRLGRMQYKMARYPDARRTFNTALRYVDSDGKDADSIMVEVFQCQESMAKQMNDTEDAELWSKMLRNHEEGIRTREFNAQLREQNLAPASAEGMNGMRGRRTPSPRPLSRSNTMPQVY